MNDQEVHFQDEPALNVASSPHWRDSSSLAAMQKLWLLALTPAIAASVLYFRMHSLRILGLAIAFSVILEGAWNRIVPGKEKLSNWHSVTLAVLFSLLMPYNIPWWLVLIGCFLTIVVGKKLFGGFGAYPVHPVMLSFAMLTVSWPGRMDYTAGMVTVPWDIKMIEPIRLVKTAGGTITGAFSWQDLLLGKQVAGIGNALVLYILAGGIFLLLMRQIPWQIPAAFLIGHLAMASTLFWARPDQFALPVFYLLSGSTVFAAFFLATEPATSPVNPWPMLIYGFMGGVLMMLIRAYSNYTDGLAFTILLMNLCHPLLDRITPKVYGLEEPYHA